MSDFQQKSNIPDGSRNGEQVSPLSVVVTSASPQEMNLVETLQAVSVVNVPETRLVYDKAADSQPLRERLLQRGLKLICPFVRRRSQQIRRLSVLEQRHYSHPSHPWKIERTSAWLKHFRHLTTRWDYLSHLHQGFW